jgi:hypothetical protein
MIVIMPRRAAEIGNANLAFVFKRLATAFDLRSARDKPTASSESGRPSVFGDSKKNENEEERTQ